MQNTIKKALSSCKDQTTSIMSYIMKGLDEANISYKVNKKETEIVIANSTKKKVNKIMEKMSGLGLGISLLTTITEINKKVYIRLNFK